MGIETAIGLGIAGAGAGASAAGGKKGRKAAQRQTDQQIALQRETLGLARQAFQTGMGAWQPSFNYWNALLQGGQPARVAVGPSAALMRESYEGQRRTMEEGLPAGGERRLALAQADIGEYRDLSRLYAGVQPEAARNLMALSGIPFGVSTNLFGTGAGIGRDLLNTLYGQYAQNQALAQQGAAGWGNLLYKIWQNRDNGGG